MITNKKTLQAMKEIDLKIIENEYKRKTAEILSEYLEETLQALKYKLNCFSERYIKTRKPNIYKKEKEYVIREYTLFLREELKENYKNIKIRNKTEIRKYYNKAVNIVMNPYIPAKEGKLGYSRTYSKYSLYTVFCSSKSTKSPVGEFSYRHIPTVFPEGSEEACRLFFCDYDFIKLRDEVEDLLAKYNKLLKQYAPLTV